MARVVRSIGVVVLATLLAVDLVVVVLLGFLVVSTLAGNEAGDQHGFVRIFSLVALIILVPIGLALLALLRRLA